MNEGNSIVDGVPYDQMLPDPATPLPWPEAEPEPTQLDEQVNWLTYAHRELYDMVHQGMDVSSAASVSTRWAGLGDALKEIGDELHAALDASVDAWQGTAAEKARGTIAALSQWATDTATNATNVAGCVAHQAESAVTARSQMPEPVDEPTTLMASPSAGTTSAASASPFVGGGFGSASLLMADLLAPSQSTAAHQQAARVMEQFQAESRDNYRTVPQFAPPLPKPGAPAPGQQPPAPLPPAPAPPAETAPQSAGLRPASAGGSVIPHAAPSAGSVGLGTGYERPGAGGAVPAAVSGHADRPAAPPASARGPMNAGPLGGPMMPPAGGLAAGQGGTEHKVKPMLQDDDDIWHVGGPLIPPVIGEGGGCRA